MRTFNAIFLLVFSLALTMSATIAAHASDPILVLKNNFGEQTSNFVIGGSNQLDCNFVVDSTNGNGLGIRSLKGAACAAVYMHTSATPAVGNPNPAAGYILIQFAKSYSGYVSGYSGYVSPLSGSQINVTTGVTSGLAYVITSLGTTPASQWQSLGFPASETPSVGAAFIANTSATATGTGTVQVPAAAGSTAGHIEVVGDPNQTSLASSGGGQMVLVNLAATNSSTTTLAATAPANSSVIGLRFTMGTLPPGI